MLELLSPAGSYETFEAAIAAGADAVYAGGAKFGARAYAENFSQEEILRAIDKCHLYGKRIYLTVNTLCKDREIQELYDFLAPFYRAGLHGVIVQDLGVIRCIKNYFPGLSIHASTQMTLAGAEGARFLKSLGANRIVTSRELDLSEIRRIHEGAQIEIESFIHGAMCYCYSGQCLFSSVLGGRSGNRGRCAQPCRLPYEVLKDGVRLNRPEESYVLSMKDMCGLSMIPRMAEAGVVSFKIEGRMKKAEYSAGVTAIYRKYLDLYESRGREGFRVREEDVKELQMLYTRGGSETGYLDMRNGRRMITLRKPGYQSNIKESVLPEIQKIPVRGTCIVRKDMPVTLSVACNGRKISEETEPAQEAQKRPVTEDDVRKQLLKTGATDFFFEKLEIELEDHCFVPVKVLNHLRCRVMEDLEEMLCKPFRREEGRRDHTLEREEENQSGMPQPKIGRPQEYGICRENGTPALYVMVSGLPEAEALCREEIDGIYLESRGTDPNSDKRLQKLHRLLSEEGKKLYLALPYIFRSDVKREYPLDFFDGVLARNYEELQWLKESGYQGRVRTDFNVYTFNREAGLLLRESLQKQMELDTVPLELSSHEMRERGIRGSELAVYGRVPMMISAQCLNKTFGRCGGRRHASELLYLRDRCRKEFPVLADCENCVNLIYNSVPLSLHARFDMINRMRPPAVRLVFTDENTELMRKIIQAYRRCIDGEAVADFPVAKTTAGHFKRGVE